MVVEIFPLGGVLRMLSFPLLGLVLLLETQHQRIRAHCVVLFIHGDDLVHLLSCHWGYWLLLVSLVCEEDLRSHQGGLGVE